MKLKTLLVINAAISIVFGLTFVLIPWQVVSLYGIEPNPPLNYVGQLFGAALITFAILSWTARNVAESDARSAIVRAFFIGDGIGFIVSLIAQLTGVVNALGWSTVAIYLLLTIGFGYFRFTKTVVSKS
jgi:hypothetical protein